ncbi:MAG: hypothetical protein WCO10_03180 [bacterium]
MAKSWEVRFPIGIPVWAGASSLSLGLRFFRVTVDKFGNEGKSSLLPYLSSQNFQKNVVINGIKEFFHITFKRIAWHGVILTDPPEYFLYGFYSLMRTFVDSARKRTAYKTIFKQGIESVENSMVEDSISDCGFVDMPDFRVGDIKSFVRTVMIGSILEIMVKLDYVLFKFKLKFGHIRLARLAFFKFAPS